MMLIGLGLTQSPRQGSSLGTVTPPVTPPVTQIDAAGFWDARDLADGTVTFWPDLAGTLDQQAVVPPTALNGALLFDGASNAMQTEIPSLYHKSSGVKHVADYTLPDADGGDPGQGFSIAGFTQDTDGTWWAANGGLNWDGSGDERHQSIVHLSADFSTNLGEIDIDALWENDESPQGVALDAANDWLWVLDPTGQAIRSVNRDGTRNNSQDISRGYAPGSVCMAQSGDALWVMSRGAGDAIIQKISTDGSKTVSVNGTVDLNSRHDHIFEYGGVLYVSCGTNGSQAFVVVLDAETLAPLGQVDLPYPAANDGLVGIEGIWIGPNGKCFVSHNGYFHYGEPTGVQAPMAEHTFPRNNIVVEYNLPVIASRDLDLFWFGSADPSGNDCAFQIGSSTDNLKTFPSLGMFINGNQGSIDFRKNTSAGSGGDMARVTISTSDISLIYIEVRGATVNMYQNGVLIGSDTLNANADGFFGLADHPVEIGGSVTNDTRYTNMKWLSGGVIIGSGADRSYIEGYLAWRHDRADLLPATHPFKDVAP